MRNIPENSKCKNKQAAFHHIETAYVHPAQPITGPPASISLDGLCPTVSHR